MTNTSIILAWFLIASLVMNIYWAMYDYKRNNYRVKVYVTAFLALFLGPILICLFFLDLDNNDEFVLRKWWSND